jgi:hypothetical protein
MLKPSLDQMLQVGQGAGLSTIAEAFLNYTRHYDLFFQVGEYAEQLAYLVFEMRIKGMMAGDEIREETIDAAMERCKIPRYDLNPDDFVETRYIVLKITGTDAPTTCWPEGKASNELFMKRQDAELYCNYMKNAFYRHDYRVAEVTWNK